MSHASLPLVIHVLPTLAPYGAERVAIELAARLPSRGFRTRLLVLFEDGPLRDEIRKRDIRWTFLGGTHGTSRLAVLRALRMALFGRPEQRPAIIHTHLFGGDAWTAAACAWERISGAGRGLPRTRLISTAHNVDVEDSMVRRLARSWSMHRMDRVAAISREVERYAHEALHIPAERIVHIPNGIDLSRVMPRGGGPFHDIPRLLMVGRLEPQKGQETVLQALASVHAPWQLDIIGAGSLERTLKEAAERSGIASRVHFLGQRDDVPAQMAQADLLLFPSRWEGMGLVPLEAAVAGVPVLASNLPALRESFPRELLLDPHAPDAWREAIAARLMDSAACVAAAQRLAPIIRNRYDVETMTDRYAALYRDVLSQ